MNVQNRGASDPHGEDEDRKLHILVLVEDGQVSAQDVCDALLQVSDRFVPMATSDIGQSLMAIEGGGVDLVMVDLGLPDEDRIHFLTQVRLIYPGTAVLLISVERFRRLRIPTLRFAATCMARLMQIQAAGSEEDDDEDASVAPELGEAWAGFEVTDLIQIFCMKGWSRTIMLVYCSEMGLIHLREGNLIHAEVASLTGVPALAHMLAWPRPHIGVHPPLPKPRHSIRRASEAAILEAAKMADETRKGD